MNKLEQQFKKPNSSKPFCGFGIGGKKQYFEDLAAAIGSHRKQILRLTRLIEKFKEA